MSNFILDNLPLPELKADLQALHGGTDTTKFLTALDFNTVRQYLSDIRDTVLARTTVSVRDFGAKGDGSTDDTAAIQAAIDQVKALPRGGRIYFPTGKYMFSSLNLTGIGASFNQALVVEGDGDFGSQLAQLPQTAGTNNVGLDLSGSNNIRFHNLYLTSGVNCDILIFMARMASSPNCNNHHFERVKVQGGASTALLYNYGAENVYFDRCTILSEGAQPLAAIYVTSINSLGRSSPHGAIVTGVQSCIDNHINRTIVLSSFVGGVNILLDGNPSLEIDGLSSYNTNGAPNYCKHIVCQSGAPISNFSYPVTITNSLFEGYGAAIWLKDNGAGVGPYQHLTIRHCWNSQGGDWVKPENNNVIMTYFTFEGNSDSGSSMALNFGIVERSKVETLAPYTTIAVNGYASGCTFACRLGNITFAVGGDQGNTVHYREPDYVTAAGDGTNRLDMGKGTPLQLRPRAADLSTAQKTDAIGSILMADGSTWDPCSLGGGPYLVVYTSNGWRPLRVLSVADFGAKGDGVTDDTAAIQAAINAAHSVATVLDFDAKTYRVNTSLNVTGKSGLILRGRGIRTQIKAHCTGRALFDCTGSYNLTFRDMWIEGDASDVPAAAFLFARDNTNASAGLHALRDVVVQKNWAKAAVVSISSEVNVYANCQIYNWQAGAAVVSITAQNDTSIVSSYATFPGTWSGGNTVTKFTNCVINSIVSAGDVTADNVRLDTATDVAFVGCFFSMSSGGGRAGVHLTGSCDAVNFYGCSAEWETAQYGILLDSGVIWSNSEIAGFSARNMIKGASGSTIQKCQISGNFPGSPYGMDVDTFLDNLVTTYDFLIIIRTKARGNIFWGNGSSAGGSSLVTFPTDTDGNLWADYIQGSDGHNRHTWNVGRDGLLSRTATHYLRSHIFKEEIQNFGSVATFTNPAGNNGVIDVNKGSTVQIKLDANVTLPLPSNVVSAGTNTFDEGIRVRFIFEQDATGGRTVTFNAGYRTTFVPSTTAGKFSVVEFMLTADGYWVQTGGTAGI